MSKMPAPVNGGVGCRCSRASQLFILVLMLAVSIILLVRQQSLILSGWRTAQQQNLQRRLPQAIVIGARKCGTRALLDFLSLHPRVIAAKGEVHYFDDAKRVNLGLYWYRQQMPESRHDQITLEKSPAYFVTEEAPPLMRRMNSSLRIVLILRDPVTRIVSDYTQLQQRRLSLGRPTKSLEQTILNKRGRVNPHVKMVKVSMYHKHLRRWLRYFPAKQIHLVDGDHLAIRPYEELQRVETFLGLPGHIGPGNFVFNSTKGFYCVKTDSTGGQRCLGRGKGRRHPTVLPSTLAKLRSFFKRYDNHLANLVGRRFRWMGADPSEEDE